MDTLTVADTLLTHQSSSDMLVELLARRLARFVRPAQLRRELEEIISELRKKPTRIKDDAFDKLMGMASSLNIQGSSERPQSIALKQIAFLKDIIANDDIDMRTSLLANAQLTDLVGTSAKHRSESYEPKGVVSIVRKMLSEMDELVEQEESISA